MQLIKKMFGRGPGAGPAPGSESAQFQDSESNSEPGSRNTSHRELVQVVLRDSMRRHGIPSAWIDCRTLSVVTRSQRTGMHVQFIVCDGIDRLLNYVPAFQTSFREEILRFDPRVDDWLLSLSWQFQNLTSTKIASLMPDPATWAGTTMGAPLQAQALGEPVRLGAATPAFTAAPTAAPTVRPAPRQPPAQSSAPASAAVDAARDDEVMEDLQALYAIRDAALRQGRSGPAGPAGERDFESTHPGLEPGAGPSQPKGW